MHLNLKSLSHLLLLPPPVKMFYYIYEQTQNIQWNFQNIVSSNFQKLGSKINSIISILNVHYINHLINADMKRPSLKCIYIKQCYIVRTKTKQFENLNISLHFCIWINWLWCNLQYVSKMNIFPIRIMLYCNCLCLLTFKFFFSLFFFGGGLWWVNAFCGKLLGFFVFIWIFFWCWKIAFEGWTMNIFPNGEKQIISFFCWLHTFRQN